MSKSNKDLRSGSNLPHRDATIGKQQEQRRDIHGKPIQQQHQQQQQQRNVERPENKNPSRDHLRNKDIHTNKK